MEPVFLIGAERSGTTLVRLMLDGHPLISWTHEFEYAVDQIISPNSWPDMSSYIDWLATDRSFMATGFRIDRSLNYPSLIKSFLVQKQKQSAKPIIGATCHRHYDRLLRIFPQARFIYLIRDPRDVARSNIGMGWAGNVWNGVDRWIEAEKLWTNIKNMFDSKISYVEVRFEELIISPEKILNEICKFLNIDYNSKMLNYPLYTTYSKPDPKLVDQWRRKQTKKQIALVEYKTKEFMKKRNYIFNTHDIKGPYFLEVLYLMIQNKAFQILFRIKRYGLRLFLSYFFARKFKIGKLERKYKLQINDIQNRYLK